MPGIVKIEKITAPAGSDLRQLEIQHNNAVSDDQQAAFACSGDYVWSWQTAVTASGQALGRGSTDTNIGSGQLTLAINGIPVTKAAVAAGTAIGAQTVTADMWAAYSLDIVAAGTITVSPAAGNVAGYATEALAIAAVPARVTAKARMGYITVKTKAATAWIAGTDGLAGGSTGNFASITNYYPFDGMFAATGTATNPAGVVTASTSGPGVAWTGGRNGVLIPTVLAIGSTDTNVSNTAFTFSANGVTNIAKAAVAAGTALGALGTTPANQWAIFGMYIDSLGVITFLAGPSNASTGYPTEQQAIGDLAKIFPVAGKAQMGYFTVKTMLATAWIAGTDALGGGTTGNEASATNYYPTAGISPAAGNGASQIAGGGGTVLGAANY